MKLEIVMEQGKCSNMARQDAVLIFVSASHSETRSFHSLLYELSKQHTWSQHVFPQRMACLCDVGKSQTFTHFGEAQVLIKGAHTKMTNKNTQTLPCCMNTFISYCVSKHNSQAPAPNMAFTLITSAELLNQKETEHCLSGFSSFQSH